VDFATACLDGGARFLQVRAKQRDSGWFLDVTARIVERASAAGALVVVNDRADIARLSGAGGLHLGQDDLPVAAARSIVGPDVVIGLSTHTTEQLAAAIVAPAGYVAVGPVFETASKDTGYSAVGLEMVRDAALVAGRQRLPVVAIGGITLERAASVIAAGAGAVAVISDLLSTGDPAARVRDYLRRL
jgi:thiamine-phosphate pyrophosphorylase